MARFDSFDRAMGSRFDSLDVKFDTLIAKLESRLGE